MKIGAYRVRRNPWVTAASCIPWACIPFLIAAGPPASFVSFHAAIIGAIVFRQTWLRKPRAGEVRADVEVDDRTIRVGRRAFRRELVTNAEMIASDRGCRVRVHLQGRGTEELVVADDRAAHRLLESLGFDPSQTVASYRIPSLFSARHPFATIAAFLLTVALSVAVSFVLPALALVTFPLGVLATALAILAPSRLVVGVDGVDIRWFWLREFIATSAILRVTRYETERGQLRRSHVELHLRDGGSVEVPVYSPQWSDEAPAIEKRIQDAVALARSAAAVGDEALVLGRGDLGFREWIARLRALGASGMTSLRSAAVPPERLWRVATNPREPPTARAAAAIALAPALDDSGKKRLADLANATAAPRLRVALERAASDASDEELEAALREIEA